MSAELPQAIQELMTKLSNMTVENGCTPAEAASAASRLQSMLDRYQVSIADLSADKLGEVVLQENLSAPAGNKRWKMSTIIYANSIAKAFNCKLINGTTKLIFVGMKSDVAVATFFFSTTWPLVREEGKKQGRAEGYSGPHLVGFYDRFLVGAGREIYERLKPQVGSVPALSAGAPAETGALVPMKKKAIAEYVAQTWGRLGTSSYRPSYQSSAGTEQGRAYGRSMPLNRGVGGRNALALT